MRDAYPAPSATFDHLLDGSPLASSRAFVMSKAIFDFCFLGILHLNMKVFVINLERSTTRRAFMQKQLDKQGVDFEFIKAVDGATLSDEYLSQVCDFDELAKRPYLLRKGVYGCQLSHYNVYKKIVAENLPYALILEDDIIIQPNFKDVLEDLALKILPNEAILLFSQNNYMPTILSEQDSEELVHGYKISYPMDPWAFGSAAGYIISKEAAQGMLKQVLPIRWAADTWGAFYNEKAINIVRCVTPYPVKPVGFKSEIDYVANTTALSKVLTFINNYRIFPFKQLLDIRRKRVLNKSIDSSFYSFTANQSPLAKVVSS